MLQKTKSTKSKDSLMCKDIFLPQSVLVKLEDGIMEIVTSTGEFIYAKGPTFIFLAKNQVVDITLTTEHETYICDFIEIESGIIKKFYNDFLLSNPDNLKNNDIIQLKYLLAPIGIGMSQVFNLLHIDIEMRLFSSDKVECLYRFLLKDFIKEKNAPVFFRQISEHTLREDIYCILAKKINHKWTLQDIAKRLFMSTSTLKRKLRQENTSFSEIILNARMNKARELLIKREMSITQVSNTCGYNSTSYFSAVFKKYFKITPTEFVTFISKHKYIQ